MNASDGLVPFSRIIDCRFVFGRLVCLETCEKKKRPSMQRAERSSGYSSNAFFLRLRLINLSSALGSSQGRRKTIVFCSSIVGSWLFNNSYSALGPATSKLLIASAASRFRSSTSISWFSSAVACCARYPSYDYGKPPCSVTK